MMAFILTIQMLVLIIINTVAEEPEIPYTLKRNRAPRSKMIEVVLRKIGTMTLQVQVGLLSPEVLLEKNERFELLYRSLRDQEGTTRAIQGCL